MTFRSSTHRRRYVTDNDGAPMLLGLPPEEQEGYMGGVIRFLYRFEQDVL